MNKTDPVTRPAMRDDAHACGILPEHVRAKEGIARLTIERDTRDLRYVTDKQLIEKPVAEDPNLCHFVRSKHDEPDFSAF